MTKKEAYKLGVYSGYEAGMDGDFTPGELSSEGDFLEAALEICENKRQYASSPTYSFMAMRPNEDLFDAFDEGEAVGVRKAWRERKRKQS